MSPMGLAGGVLCLWRRNRITRKPFGGRSALVRILGGNASARDVAAQQSSSSHGTLPTFLACANGYHVDIDAIGVRSKILVRPPSQCSCMLSRATRCSAASSYPLTFRMRKSQGINLLSIKGLINSKTLFGSSRPMK